MAQDQLEEIKNNISLVELISEYVSLKKAGRNFKAVCPFHSETAPSFMVSPERQIFKCFGCGEGGDHFRFLMKIEGMEFVESLRYLAKRAGVKLKSYQPSQGEKNKQLLFEINHLAGEYYHYLLLHHSAGKRALDYILGRGITQESLKRFKLGFAPNLWTGLQSYLTGKKGYQVEDLERAGLVIKSSKGYKQSYYDRFRNRLMFPLKDHRGNACGFAGRLLSESSQAKYVNSPETLVYHKSNLLYGLDEVRTFVKKVDQLVLVEGELDMISSYQAGVKNVAAIKGSALTEPQVRLLGRFTQNIILALDRDLAGDIAARRGIEIADQAGLMIRVVKLRGGKDPDEVAQKNPKLWRQLVKEAVPIFDYLLSSALERFGTKTAQGKRRVGLELIPVLAKINDEIVKAHYIALLADSLQVSERVIMAQMEKVIRSKSPRPVQRGSGQKTVLQKGVLKTRREILEEHLLALVFQSDDWSLLVKKRLAGLVKTPRFVRILEVLKQYLKRYKTHNSQRLAKMMAAELVESFNHLYLIDFSSLIEDDEKLSAELEKTIERISELNLKEKLRQIAREIKNLEKKTNLDSLEKDQLKKFDREFSKLSQKLSGLTSFGK
ncbi:DNA primase [Patescibacteria group bacterium]